MRVGFRSWTGSKSVVVFGMRTAGSKGVRVPRGVSGCQGQCPIHPPESRVSSARERGASALPALQAWDQTEPWHPWRPGRGAPRKGPSRAQHSRSTPARPPGRERVGTSSGGLDPGPGTFPLGSSRAGVVRGRSRPHRLPLPRRPLAPAPRTRPRSHSHRRAPGRAAPAQVTAGGRPR